MSENNPYEILGVTENASFEEIQAAKQRISKQYSEDNKMVERVETAYDSIIMERLRLRQEGKIKVPERIRFPERSVELPAPKTPILRQNTTNWWQQLVDNPSQREILIPTGVFLSLAIITVISLNNNNYSSLSLLMGLGFMSSLYFLNRKEKRFGRSLLISLVALLGGVGLGAAIAGTLKGSGVFISTEQVGSAVTFTLFWFASCFLR
ncbi:MAG: CPP1-like family protein [Xenococcaceae cyanobacterium MO_188.B19]|nr:CPP1-like family protein [Xenococcaceae cyanobacterium MO_188.B19]